MRQEIIELCDDYHALSDDTSEARYGQAAAELAWSRTVAFLERHLAAAG